MGSSLVANLEGHTSDITKIKFNPQGLLYGGRQLVATASRDYSCRVWEATTGQMVRMVNCFSSVNAIVWKDEETFITGCGSGRIQQWKVNQESNNSERGSSSDRDRPGSASTLEERLRAMQGEPGEPRGRWLEKELEQWKKKTNFDENSEPTAEEIKMQLKLPPRAPPGQQPEFKEPLRQWEVKNI